jgi:hypothetical protein
MTTSRRKPKTADSAVNPVTSAAAWAIPERAFTPSNIMQQVHPHGDLDAITALADQPNDHGYRSD